MVNTVHNYTVNVATAHITVSLQNTVIGDHKYFVTVTPPVETGPSNFETRDETFQVTVLYNQEYNVSVVANNCAGNSSSVSTSFNISKIK